MTQKTTVPAPELTRASIGPNPELGRVIAVTVTPTQVRKPWRAAIRTTFQALVALATLVPFVVTGVYQESTDYPVVVVQVLAVSGAISRVMALPQVEEFLRQFLPILSASGKQDTA